MTPSGPMQEGGVGPADEAHCQVSAIVHKSLSINGHNYVASFDFPHIKRHKKKSSSYRLTVLSSVQGIIVIVRLTL